jgi:hypothetical protein
MIIIRFLNSAQSQFSDNNFVKTHTFITWFMCFVIIVVRNISNNSKPKTTTELDRYQLLIFHYKCGFNLFIINLFQ